MATVVAQQVATDRPRADVAATNPWTRGNPEGWWIRRHEAIMALPQRAGCQIAFVGDSITDGWDAESGGLRIWEKELAPLKAYNLGMPDDCTEHVLWRIDNGAVDKAWSNLKLLVVEVGTDNRLVQRDQPEDIAAGIEAICVRVKTNVPGAKIALMDLFPHGSDEERFAEVNARIAKLADGERVFYLGITPTLLMTPDAVGQDGATLTDRGYGVWVEALRPIFKRFLPAPE